MSSAGCDFVAFTKNEELQNYSYVIPVKKKKKAVFVFSGELSGMVDLDFELQEGAFIKVFVVTILSGKSDLTINYKVRHINKETGSSFESFGIVDDNAKKTTNMEIDFEKGSDGAIGNEREEVILLSETAKNTTLPVILCNEEGAHGNHSVSIGHIDSSELYYLKLRGLSEKKARDLLIRSKLNAFVSRIKDMNAADYINKKVRI